MNAFKCPKCGKLTGGNEKFCVDCGQPLNVICPECGESWRFMFEYKFCPGCGHHMKNLVAHAEIQELQSKTTSKPKAKN